jgi:uncharacterized membrane protein
MASDTSAAGDAEEPPLRTRLLTSVIIALAAFAGLSTAPTSASTTAAHPHLTNISCRPGTKDCVAVGYTGNSDPLWSFATTNGGLTWKPRGSLKVQREVVQVVQEDGSKTFVASIEAFTCSSVRRSHCEHHSHHDGRRPDLESNRQDRLQLRSRTIQVRSELPIYVLTALRVETVTLSA